MIHVVSFPGLGLEFTLNRVAFTVLGRPIYWYGIIIASGLFLAVWLCTRWSGRFGINGDQIIDMMLFAVPAALVAIRVYYVVFNLSIFQNPDGSLNWGKIVNYSDGGLAIYGAIISSAIVLLIFCHVRKISFLAFADLGVHGLFIGQLVGRWGNFMNVEAYGGVTALPWRMCSESIAQEMLTKGYVDKMGYEDILSGALGVHPTFFYESAWNLAGLIMVYLMGRKRKFDGQCFLFYVFWYGLGRAWIEGLRTDSLYLYVGSTIRVSQLLAALSALAAGAVLLAMLMRKGNSPDKLYVNQLAARQAAQEQAQAAQAAPQGAEEAPASGQEGQKPGASCQENERHKEEWPMAAVAMDGRALAARMKEHIRGQVEQMPVKPGLAVVLVGEDPASRVYVRGRKKDCAQCGIYSEEYILPQDTTQQELLEVIDLLNTREEIDGILVQFPLPEHLDGRAAALAIRPDKDVDCVHPANMGYLLLGEESLRPCTPSGVMRLMSEYGIDPAGRRCVMVGRSNIVGKPQAMMMLWKDATVTVCHTRTADLAGECRRADILITAAGHRGLITGDMVKEGAVVIDIAVNRDEQGGLCGDVVYDQAAARASYITPVPGGVGPVTRAMLMENTLLAARRHGK